MMLRRSIIAMVAAAFVAAPSASASSKATYYVSLGDSLAQGFQPIGGPWRPGAPPGYNHGYPDELAKLMRNGYDQLREVKLGCGGETTTTFRFGGTCSYGEGSQLAEAVAFLKEHGDEVAFVTIDLGGNDVIDPAGGGADAVVANLPVILDALRAAAPTVPIVGMSYYDPFIPQVWSESHDLGALQGEVAFLLGFNDLLEGLYAASGVEVADVESAFSVTDVSIQPDGLPRNVARACAWTWMCSVGDIHPNTDGYTAIARAFADKLGP